MSGALSPGPDLAVTGTDTGVGKTVVSALLTQLSGGVYVKPVQSGADDGDDDAGDVRRWTGAEALTGRLLGPSLAPAVAARRQGLDISLGDLAGVVARGREEAAGRPLVVEGAGGLLVELGTDGSTLVDLVRTTALELVVVARPGLGTLNHTMLTIDVARSRGLRIRGVVVCGYPKDPDLATRTNLAELDRLSGGLLAGVVPALDLEAAAPFADATSWLAPPLGGDAQSASWHSSPDAGAS